MPAEIEYFFHEADALAFARAAQTIDAREEFEVLRDVEIAVERERSAPCTRGDCGPPRYRGEDRNPRHVLPRRWA